MRPVYRKGSDVRLRRAWSTQINGAGQFDRAVEPIA